MTSAPIYRTNDRANDPEMAAMLAASMAQLHAVVEAPALLGADRCEAPASRMDWDLHGIAKAEADILADQPGRAALRRQACRAQVGDLILGASGRIYEVVRRTPGRGVVSFGLSYGAGGEWYRTSADIPSDALIDVR